MADQPNEEYVISDRLKRLATPRKRTESPSQGSPDPHGGAPAKQLPPEVLQKSVERLSTAQRKERPLKDLIKRTTLSREQESASVKRLYDDALQIRQKRREALEHKRAEATTQGRQDKKLDEQELGDAVSRLHERSIMQHEEEMRKLLRKHLSRPGETGGDAASPPKLEKGKVEEVNARLYTESCTKQRDAKAKLFEKYVLEKEPKGSRRNPQQIAEAAARLTQKACGNGN